MGVADGELADVRWAADLSRRLRTTAADVASECDVGIEDGHERLEVTVAVAARKASTTRRWLGRVSWIAGGFGSGAGRGAEAGREPAI